MTLHALFFDSHNFISVKSVKLLKFAYLTPLVGVRSLTQVMYKDLMLLKNLDLLMRPYSVKTNCIWYL